MVRPAQPRIPASESLHYNTFKPHLKHICLSVAWPCAGFLLEALDIIEIPPEPPEQAGRNLYERLEISGMRRYGLQRSFQRLKLRFLYGFKQKVTSSRFYMHVYS